MFWDTTTAEERVKGLEVNRTIQNGEPYGGGKYVCLDFWAEHCVECGAPACYDTCPKYKKGPIGACRRLSKGIVPVDGKNKFRGVLVNFEPWGKIELDFHGQMVGRSAARFLQTMDWRLSQVVSFLNSVIFKCGLRTTRNLITLYRRTRLTMARICLGHIMNPNYWAVSFYVDDQEELIFSIFNPEQGDVFIQHVMVGKGWHDYFWRLPSVGPGSFFRVFSIEGTKTPVLFARLEVGRSAETAFAEAPAKFVKCVVWDLDNTLWHGILAEDGASGIAVDDRILQIVKSLDSRGILNTICSKNDYESAWGVLQSLGISEYFVFPVINWLPKSGNIKSIAKRINIGLDSMAFVDDSAHERGEVHENLPMVRVYDENEALNLLSLQCFNPPVSKEGSKRRLSYISEMKRQDEEAVFQGDHDEFLKSCLIVLECIAVNESEVKNRVWELVNRTNQLTLAARRYSKEEFEAMLSVSKSYAIRCYDKYGDYGIVGFVAYRVEESVLDVSEFVMSCRVAKKKCENAIVNWLAERAMQAGLALLRTKVVPTGRNNALIDAFDNIPQISKVKVADGIIYSLDIKRLADVKCPVKVVADF